MANDGTVRIGTSLDEEGLRSGLEGLGSFAKKGFAAIGKAATAAIGASTAAVTALGVSAVKTGAEFDAAMSQVAATMGITADTITEDGVKPFEILRAKAQEMGAATNFSATEAAEGLNILAMSGYSAAESISMIEDVLHLAAAGAMDMANAAAYVSGAMKGFNDATKDSTYYADLMAKGATLANTSVQQLGEAISGGAATAAAYKQNAESMTLSLLRLAEQGQVGSAASTALNAAMKDLYTPTSQAKEAMDALGVSAYENGKALDFNDVVNNLSEALAGYSEEEANAYKQTIFGIQGLNAFNKMTVTSVEKQDEWAKALANAAGSASEQYATMTDNLSGDIDIWNSAVDGFKIALSDKLTPAIREMVQFGSDSVGKLTEAFQNGGLSGAVDALADIVGEGAGKIAGKIPAIVGAGAKVVNGLVKGIINNLPAIVSAGAETGLELVKGIYNLLPQLFEVGGELLQMFYMGIITGIPLLFNAAAGLIDNLVSGINGKIPDFISKALDMVQTFATTLAENAPTLISAGLNLISNLVQGIVDSLPTMIEKLPAIISTFANIINDNAPTILKAGVGMLVTLAEGIISAIPTLVANIPAIIAAIVDVWSAFNWYDLGKNAIAFLKNGVTGMVGAVKAAGTSVMNGITGVIQQLPSKLLSFGRSAVSNLAGALRNGISTIIGQARSILNGIINVLKPSSLLDVGKNLIKGLWNGISSMAGWIMDKIGGFCNDLIGGIKDFLGIHSPSRVMRDVIGKNMVAGIGIGIEAETPNLEKTSAYSAERAVASMQSAAFSRTQAVASAVGRAPVAAVGDAAGDVKVVLEKGSIAGDVTMDGTKVGMLVAPIVDIEIEQARRESGR